jgi:hypothetical protein
VKYLAYALFAGGIMLAISGAAKLPAPIPEGTEPVFLDQFPDTWPVFLVGFVATVTGLVIWWKDVFASRAVLKNDDSDGANPLSLLESLLPQLRQLAEEIDELEGTDIAERVEHLLEHTVLPFAESRQRLFDRLGMRVGAEILITAAFGERMLNRTWSAAADGYLEEARNSFRDGAAAFEEAARMVDGAAESSG